MTITGFVLEDTLYRVAWDENTLEILDYEIENELIANTLTGHSVPLSRALSFLAVLENDMLKLKGKKRLKYMESCSEWLQKPILNYETLHQAPACFSVYTISGLYAYSHIRNYKLSDFALDILLRSKRELFVAQYPKSKSHHLARLAKYPDTQIRRYLAEHKNTDPNIRRKLIAEPDGRIHSAAIKKYKGPFDEGLLNLLTQEYPFDLVKMKLFPTLPLSEKSLVSLLNHPFFTIRKLALAHPNVTMEVLSRIEDDKSPLILKIIKNHPSLTDISLLSPALQNRLWELDMGIEV